MGGDTRKSVPLLVVAGATATGKSKLAERLAELLNGEIISADSAQVYKELHIGTAKPTCEVRRRIPHHLLDRIRPDERYDVARFQQEADRAIQATADQGRLPILVGGTGLYIKAVVDRFVLQPLAPPDPRVRKRLADRAAREGSAALHRELQRVDPLTAQHLHPNDARRIIRALEVFETTGIPMSKLRDIKPEKSPYDAHVLGIRVRRDRLHRRIAIRIEGQVAAGWPEEVRGLLRRYDAEAPGLQVLGYREMVAYVRGERSLEECLARIRRDTRRYARRQETWFRHQRMDQWIDVTGGPTERTAQELAGALRKRFRSFFDA